MKFVIFLCEAYVIFIFVGMMSWKRKRTQKTMLFSETQCKMKFRRKCNVKYTNVQTTEWRRKKQKMSVNLTRYFAN